MLARQILLIVDNERLRQRPGTAGEERTRSLHQVAQQSDLLVASVGDGIYGVDRDGLVTFVNPAAARVARAIAPHELIGREAHATFHDRQPDGTPFPVQSCYITEAIQSRPIDERRGGQLPYAPTGCPSRSRSPPPR